MTFGLTNWLRTNWPDLNYEVAVSYPSREPDHREWLLTNGLGGYAMGTISGAHRRRYHGALVAALNPPTDRHIILSRVDEIVYINGKEYQLATNHWASGVVSPTGYKYLEAFTTQPTPTWVFELDGHYLIKQVAMVWGTNEVHFGYYFIPESENAGVEASISVRFLTGFRGFHEEVQGSSDDRYPQFVSPKHCVIILNESAKRLCLSWSEGEYEAQKQWWWDFQWPEESARGLPDREDLFLVGSVSSFLLAERPVSIAASLGQMPEGVDCRKAVQTTLLRQKDLLKKVLLPHSARGDMLILACDQFLVKDADEKHDNLHVLEGYPWFNESGRAAMLSLPGLTVATRRFDEAKRIFKTYSRRMVNGLLPNRLLEGKAYSQDSALEYGAADITLWWAWALHHYYKASKDGDFIKSQLPLLLDAARQYANGTTGGIKADPQDGLLRCARGKHEFTWMDMMVAKIPITPRSGKAVEICALWYNFLETILNFCQALSYDSDLLPELTSIANRCKDSMQKFWDSDRLCLFDVIETGSPHDRGRDLSMRPNQLIAVSLPYRTLTKEQEKAVLNTVENELLTPMGIRSLAPSDPAYQATYGCGFAHADQYHRDLSYHQGMAWPWLLGQYCDALINVFGLEPETTSRIGLIMQPLLSHLTEEGCLGSISEMFDGSRPHLPRGCIAEAASTAEVMRWHAWQLRR
jgi:4-alpha-glucanotransferase